MEVLAVASVAMDKAQAILDAALELFAEHGFAAVGVDRIGQRAGIPGPHIYRHFSGKDELLATLVDQAMDRLLSLTAATSEDPHEELGLLVRGHVRFALGDRRLLSVYSQEARSLSDADQRRTRRRQRALRRPVGGAPAALLSVASASSSSRPRRTVRSATSSR